MTKETSNKIKIYNIVFIIFIFFYHCDAKFYIPLIEPLSYIMGSLGLSFFFMISGYFMFAGMNDGNALSRSMKRIKTLLLPYLFWNIIFFAYFCINDPYVRQTPVNRVLFRFAFQPYNDVLWYLSALFLFSVFAFLLYRIMKHPVAGCVFIVIVTAVIVYVCVINQSWMVEHVSLGWWITKITPYIPMYLSGGMIGLHKRDWIAVPKKVWIYPLFIMLSIALVLLKYKYDDVMIFYWLSMFLGPVIMWCALPDRMFVPLKVLDILCEPSFLIYELQLMAFWIWQDIYKNIASAAKREILVCATAYVFIYAVFYIAKAIAPHLLAVATGFRNGKDFTRKKAA